MSTAVKASKVEMRAVSWLWEPYIPKGMLTLIAGVPGFGKSLFTCWLAAKVSKKARVLMSNTEDDYALTVTPRLKALGARMERIAFLDPPPMMGIPPVDRVTGKPADKLDSEARRLLHEIDAHKASLVILDPLSDHLQLSIFSPKTTQILSPLAREIAARDVAFVVVSHTVKTITKNMHPLYAVGGAAGGIARVMRVVHLFGPHPHDATQRVLAPTKANFLPDSRKVSQAFATKQQEIKRGKLVLLPGILDALGEAPDVTPSMVLVPGTDKESSNGGVPDKRLHAAQWLRSHLQVAGGKSSVKQLQSDANLAGFSWATVRRADEELVHTRKSRKGDGTHGGGAFYWELPKNEEEG